MFICLFSENASRASLFAMVARLDLNPYDPFLRYTLYTMDSSL